VKPGDTLELVADHFDVTPYQIRHWNHLRGPKLTAGRLLVVYVSAPARSYSRTTKRRASSTRARARQTATAKHNQVARASGGGASASP
jgi:LysM repeat protein